MRRWVMTNRKINSVNIMMIMNTIIMDLVTGNRVETSRGVHGDFFGFCNSCSHKENNEKFLNKRSFDETDGNLQPSTWV